MSIQGYLYIEAPLSLREIMTLCGFPAEKEIPPPPVLRHAINIETYIAHIESDLLSLRVSIMTKDKHDEAAPYGIKSDFKIMIASHIYYDELLKLIAEIVKTTPYNLGLFMTSHDKPILIRKDQKLTLDGDPDKGLPEWLNMFKDIPHELVEF